MVDCSVSDTDALRKAREVGADGIQVYVVDGDMNVDNPMPRRVALFVHWLTSAQTFRRFAVTWAGTDSRFPRKQ